VLKELIDPLGGVIDIRAVVLGDVTMSVLDIWGAEYQENDAMLIRPASLSLIASICERERLPFSVVGEFHLHSGDPPHVATQHYR
jgi:phosphoribosylformylglycinamidine synthase